MMTIISTIIRVEKLYSGTKTEENPVLRDYSTKTFRNPDGQHVYEDLAELWLLLLQQNHPLMQQFKGTRFLLDIMIKSMTLKLHANKELEYDYRVQRFSSYFIQNLKQLVKILFFGEVGAMESLDAISGFPILLRQLLHIVDRGVVFEMIGEYMSSLKNSSTSLGNSKFLQLLLDCDEYVELNAPIPLDQLVLASMNISDLTSQFSKQHFLIGVLLQEIEDSISRSNAIRTQLIIILRNLMKKHDTDIRYQKREYKERIANMYFVYIPLFTEYREQFVSTRTDEQNTSNAEVMVCVIWILKNCSRELLREWWLRDTQRCNREFLRILASCLRHFQMSTIREDVYSVVVDVIVDFVVDYKDDINSGTSSFIHYVFSIIKILVQGDQCDDVSLNSSEMQIKHSKFDTFILIRLLTFLKYFIHTFKHALFSFSSNSKYCELLSYELLRICNFHPDLEIRSKATTLFYLLLKKNFEETGSISLMNVQATVAISRLVGGVRGVKITRWDLTNLQLSLKAVENYSKKLLKKETHNKKKKSLSEREGEQTQNTDKQIEEDKEEITKKINNVKLEELEEKYKNKHKHKNEEHTKAEKKEETNTNTKKSRKSFRETENGEKNLNNEIQSLISRMFRVITYCLEINQKKDPHTISKLYHKISLNFLDTPDLRVRWLENLADYQILNKNIEEAAQCKIQIAALVAGYLKNHGVLPMIGDISEVFSHLSPNVLLNEPTFSERKGNEKEVDFFHDGSTWSLEGLTTYLTDAAELLKQCEQYEICTEIQMMLTKIYSREKDYSNLRQTLLDFESVTSDLITANESVRIFPVYYRVGFYGKKFEELNGKKFIYKVAGTTKLGHMQNILKEQHLHRLSDENDLVFLQSNNETLFSSEMEDSKIYLMIAGVKPYFPTVEDKPLSPYQQHFGIDKFIFESGFSKGGKNVAKEGLAEQQKKKTIFTVSRKFPNLTSRMEVIHSEEFVISALANAIELIEGRLESLKAILSSTSPSMNALQSVLQGSVVTMVNEGPLKICEIFLKKGAVDTQGNPYNPQQISYLRDQMSEFIRACAFAIRLNSSLISSEHIPFQNMCETKYAELSQAVKKYLN